MTALKTIAGVAVFLALYALADWLPTVMPHWLQGTLTALWLFSIPVTLWVALTKLFARYE